MLPLSSMTIPMVTGISAWLKTESFCSTPSSYTRKLSCLRLSTMRPFLSTTVACNTTRLTSTLMVYSRFFSGAVDRALAGSGVCAGKLTADASKTPKTVSSRSQARPSNLLSGSIVSGSGINLERRQALGRIQFDLDPPPATVADQVRRSVPNHVLVSQFDGNLLSDVRQFVGIFDAEHPAPRDLRQLGEQTGSSRF